MKRIALSVAVLAASAAWVWHEAGSNARDGDILGTTAPAGDAALPPADKPRRDETAIAPPPANPEDEPGSETSPGMGTADRVRPGPPAAPQTAAAPSSSAPLEPVRPPLFSRPAHAYAATDVPTPRPRPPERVNSQTIVRAALTVAAAPNYADGTYTGPVVDAYYGPIQIQAVISNGRLTAIRVLQYPSDRRTSVYINRQALPLLRDEVIAAQSATVDIVTGATLTSSAFIRSLDAALRNARA